MRHSQRSSRPIFLLQQLIQKFFDLFSRLVLFFPNHFRLRVAFLRDLSFVCQEELQLQRMYNGQ